MPFARDVPMLTNIPETAEQAQAAGADVYFLSDRPETEEFLARKTPERPYKQILRDVRSTRPSEDQMLLSEARRDFGGNEGQKMLGFDPNYPPNPGEIAKTARDQYFNLATPDQMQAWDEKTLKLHYAEAEKRGKAAYQEAIGKVNAAKNVLSMFEKSWMERQKQIKATQEPSKEPLVPVMENGRMVYRRRTEAVGKEPPPNLVAVQDAEGNIIYQTRPQAVGATVPRKGKRLEEKEEEKAAKEEKEARSNAMRVPGYQYSSDIEKDYIYKSELARIRGTTPPEPPEEVLELRTLPKGTKIDPKNREHVAILRRIKREAMGEAKGDKEKAKKLFNKKLESKGWILP